MLIAGFMIEHIIDLWASLPRFHLHAVFVLYSGFMRWCYKLKYVTSERSPFAFALHIHTKTMLGVAISCGLLSRKPLTKPGNYMLLVTNIQRMMYKDAFYHRTVHGFGFANSLHAISCSLALFVLFLRVWGPFFFSPVRIWRRLCVGYTYINTHA